MSSGSKFSAAIPKARLVVSSIWVCAALLAHSVAGANETGGANVSVDIIQQGFSGARIPFVANEGQISDPGVLFYARTFGGTVYVTDEGRIVYALPFFEDDRSSAVNHSSARRPAGGVVFHEAPAGDARRTVPKGVGRSAASVNMFVGNDPARWKSDIPSFEKVSMGEVYDGIELTLSARGDNVEKIFTVAPGIDPARIGMRMEGVERIRALPDGELELTTGLGPVRFTAPVAYQVDGGRRTEGGLPETSFVEVAYRVEGDTVGFDVGAYDAGRPLIIDPLLASTFLGGGNDDVIRAMCLHTWTDSPGGTNIFVAGYTASADFPVTAGTYQGGSYDAFVSKFDKDLENLSASTFIGGAGDDRVYAMAFNPNLNQVIIAGYTDSPDFPVTTGGYGGGGDAFVGVLNTGLALLGARFIGGSNVEVARGVAVADNNRIYVAGYTASENFPIYGPHAPFQGTFGGSNDAFVASFEAGLSPWNATYLGGSDFDRAHAIALDNDGNVFVAGHTASTNFPGGIPHPDAESLAGTNMFIAKLRPNLDVTPTGEDPRIYGGSGVDVAYGLALNSLGRPFVAGYTTSEDFPGIPFPGNWLAPGYRNEYGGGKDAVITHWRADLADIVRSTYLGGSGDEEARGIFIDPGNNIHVTGWTSSTDFPVTAGVYDASLNGGRDVFLSSFAVNDLRSLSASTYHGGAHDDIGYAVVQSPGMNFVFVAGSTESGNFPKTLHAYQQFPHPESRNGFVSKFVKTYSYGTMKWRYQLMDSGIGKRAGPTFGPDGTIYLADEFAWLFAMDMDGGEKWVNMGDMESPTGGRMESAPAVLLDGNIYICSSSNLYGINPAGNIIMTTPMGGSVYGSPAIGSNGTIYVARYRPAALYAVDPEPPAGDVLWSIDLSAETDFIIGSPVVGSDGRIYVAGEGETFSSLFSITDVGTNGIINWSEPLGANTFGSPAVGLNDDIYVSSDGFLWSYRHDGHRNWLRDLDGLSDGLLEFSSPVADKEFIYVGIKNRFFQLRRGTGFIRLRWDLSGQIDSSAAIGDGGSVYVGGGDRLYSLNSVDGTTNWVFDTGGRIGMSSPLIGSDGTVYIAGGLYVYALWGREQLADAPWPMYHHDPLRSRNATMDAVAPPAPTNIGATTEIGDRIRVTWDHHAGFEPGKSVYEVWRAPPDHAGDPGAYEFLGLAADDSYEDGFVPIGYNYYYRVRSRNPLMAGALSSSPGALGGRPTVPPERVDATKGFPPDPHSTNALAWWSECSGNPARYFLYRSTENDPATADRLVTSTTATNYWDSTLPPGVTNYYWVQSHNMTTTSEFSVAATGGIAPLAPAIVSAEQGTETDYIEVSWSEPAGRPEYRVFRSEDSDWSNAECIDSNVVAGTYRDGEFDSAIPIPFKTYYYWIKSTNVFGVSRRSSPASGFRTLAPPGAVSATRDPPGSRIDVSWDYHPIHTNPPMSYMVFRSESDDPGTAERVATISFQPPGYESVYSDLGITRGLSYHYWVKARNAYGTSDFSPRTTRRGGTRPRAPLNISVSPGVHVDRINVEWSASVGAIDYWVWRNTSMNAATALLAGFSPTPSFVDRKEIIPGTRYYYWVRAANEFGLSDFSGFDYGWQDLAPPTGVSASDGVSTEYVEIAWNPSVNATAYDVWRGTNSDAATARELFSGVAATSFADRDATVGQVYYYRVRARNEDFTSGLSDHDSGYRSLGYLDIAVSDFVFLPPVTGPGARPNAVSFRLTNRSDQDMRAPNHWVESSFYLSPDGSPDSGRGILLGTYLFSMDLDAGGSVVMALPEAARSRLTIPEGAFGSFNVFVHADHVLPSRWHDPNMGNNTASRLGGPIEVRDKAPAPFSVSDFSGDGRADLAVYHEESGAWFVRGLDGTVILWGAEWGGPGFRPVAGDFDGDGIADLAVYHEESGAWYIRRVDGPLILWGAEWGGPGFRPVWGDYSGDGAADLAVYHDESGAWYIRRVDGTPVLWGAAWGGPGFRPAPGDYDGGGRADFAVFTEGRHNWYIRNMSGFVLAYALSWGDVPGGFMPVPGDYAGDGAADLAVYHNASGYWFIRSLTGEEILWGGYWGGAGFAPVTGDFTGDGRNDLAVYHESTGTWYVRCVDGSVIAWAEGWGGPGFKPVGLGR